MTRLGEPADIRSTGRPKGASNAAAPQANFRKPRGYEDGYMLLRELEYEVARDLRGRAVVRLTIGGNCETYYVDDVLFAYRLRLLYSERRHFYTATGKMPAMITEPAIREVVKELLAQAEQAAQQNFQRRVVEIHGERYIDLGRRDWRMLRINRDGWYITPRPTNRQPFNRSVRLVRAYGMGELPEPDREGMSAAWATLRRTVCATMTDDDFLRLQCFLLAVWRPGVPAPIGVLTGPPASFKTSIARMVLRITDPSPAGVRMMPRKIDDLLAVLRTEGRLTAFDNVTGDLPMEIVDLLCMHATGATGARRELYAHHALNVPLGGAVLITSVGSPVDRSDLATRVVEFATKSPDALRPYLPEVDLEPSNARLAAGLVAALADAVSTELRNRDRVTAAGAGRIADFERGSRAAAPGFGSTEVAVETLFRSGQRALRRAVGEADPVVTAIIDYITPQREEGLLPPGGFKIAKTISQWHAHLIDKYPRLRLPQSGFPPSSIGFGRRINDPAVVAALKTHGVGIKVVWRGNVRLLQFAFELPAGLSVEHPASAPADPCPLCSGAEWWRALETNGAWCCRACEPMPMVVHDLSIWPPSPSDPNVH
jgi:hypothetical protein